MERVLIVGAGGAGSELLEELRKEMYARLEYTLVGFVDDDDDKIGSDVMGLNVLGKIDDLPELLKTNQIDTLFIAIPSTDGQTVRRIINRCQGFPVKIRIVPRLSEIINGTLDLEQVRDIQVEDVLGRAVVRHDFSAAAERAHDQVMMIFGAAGSIGSELCKQLVSLAPRHLICVDIWENGIFELERKLEQISEKLDSVLYPKITFIISNIQNTKKIDALVGKYNPDVIFNAAAYKHVPLMEHNPSEAVENNIGGTRNLFDAAVKHSVGRFILISSDKAVNPTNVMGATKRATEMLMHVYSSRGSSTSFSAVRFGNVLNSNGSVIPTFKQQIKEGRITVTHPDIYRYFMTVQEASQLVLQCWLLGGDDQIYILEMGEPVRIADLADLMIRLSGREPGRDVEVDYIGLRPGEKMCEELLTEVEETTATKNSKIFILSRDQKFKHDEFISAVDEMLLDCVSSHSCPGEVKARLKSIVPTYHERRL